MIYRCSCSDRRRSVSATSVTHILQVAQLLLPLLLFDANVCNACAWIETARYAVSMDAPTTSTWKGISE